MKIGGSSAHNSNSRSSLSGSRHSSVLGQLPGAVVTPGSLGRRNGISNRSNRASRASSSTRRSNLRSHLVDPMTRRSLLRHPPDASFHPGVHTLIEQPNLGPELVWDDIEANDGSLWPAYEARVVAPPHNYRTGVQCRDINSNYSPSKIILKESIFVNEEYVPINEMDDDETLVAIFTHLFGKSKSAIRSFVRRYFDTDYETTPKGVEELIRVKNLFQQQQLQLNPAMVFPPIPPADVFLSEMREKHREAIKLFVEQIQGVVERSENKNDTVSHGRELILSISGEGACNILDITDNILRRVFSILYRHKDNDEFVRSFVYDYFDLDPEHEEDADYQDDDGEIILRGDRNVTRDRLFNILFLQIKNKLRISESEEHAIILGNGLLQVIHAIQRRNLNMDFPAELIELVFKEGLFLKDNDPLELSVKLKDVYFNGAKFHEDNMTGVKYNRRRKLDLSSDPKHWEKGHPGQHPEVRRFVPGVGAVGPDISEDEQRIRMQAWWQANRPPVRVINTPKQKKTESRRQSKRRRQTANRQNYDGGSSNRNRNRNRNRTRKHTH